MTSTIKGKPAGMAARVAQGALGAAALALLAGPALADVKAGVDAWSSGDFNTRSYRMARPGLGRGS